MDSKLSPLVAAIGMGIVATIAALAADYVLFHQVSGLTWSAGMITAIMTYASRKKSSVHGGPSA